MFLDGNVLISGSSKGLGRELSVALKKVGFNVITMGFETLSEVDIRCDLTDEASSKVAVGDFFKKFGLIDILILNAGSGKSPSQSLNKVQCEEYFYLKNFVTAKNLLSATDKFLKSPGCSIIAISSIAALIDSTGAPAGYAQAKRKLNELVRQSALTFAQRGIRANIISPGNIIFKGARWEELSQSDPKYVEKLLQNQVPLHSFIDPSEIADTIVFLSSYSARNITGANLVIDGGQIL